MAAQEEGLDLLSLDSLSAPAPLAAEEGADLPGPGAAAPRRRSSGAKSADAAAPQQTDEERAREERLDALAVEVFLAVEDGVQEPESKPQDAPRPLPRAQRALWRIGHAAAAALGAAGVYVGLRHFEQTCEKPLALWALVFGLLVCVAAAQSARRWARAEALRLRPEIERRDAQAAAQAEAVSAVLDNAADGSDSDSDGGGGGASGPAEAHEVVDAAPGSSVTGTACRVALWLATFVWVFVGMAWVSAIDRGSLGEAEAHTCPPELFEYCWRLLLGVSVVIGGVVLWVGVQMARDCQPRPRGVHPPGRASRPGRASAELTPSQMAAL